MFNKNLKVLSLALLLLFIIYPPVHAEPEQSKPDLPKPYPKIDFSKSTAYKVLRVIDGDTIDIEYEGGEKERIRFIGVNTPETKHPRKSIEPYGPEASAFLTNLLTGEFVYLDVKMKNGEPERDNTPSRRILAYLYRAPDKLFVNMEIVRQGYGMVSIKYKSKHKALLLHHAYKARQAKRGLWNFENYRPKSRKVDPAWEHITVYVSQTKPKYHTGECELRDTEKEVWVKVTLAEAEHDYKPCSECDLPE